MLVPIFTMKFLPKERNPEILSGLIVHGIEGAEALHADGSDKLAHAIDFVQTGIGGLNAVRPGTVDPTAYAAIGEVISKSVDFANGLHRVVTPASSAPTSDSTLDSPAAEI